MKYPEQESSILEFKREIPKNDQIIKTIIGFCNQKGGRLIIGINDDGTVVGIDETNMHTILEYLEQSILDASHPPIVTEIYAQRLFDKVVFIIEVTQGMNKPYFLKRDGVSSGTYIRLGRSTVKATPELIEELKWDSRGISFDKMPMYQAQESDLDLEKFNRFLATRKNTAAGKTEYASVQDAMLAYHVIIHEHNHTYPTVCGILLFGKNPQFFFTEARIMCNQFAGMQLTNEVIASKDCLGTIDNQFREAYNFVISRLYHSWKIVGVHRKETLEVPEDAVREIVMNAVIHRNYHIPGPSKIAIFNDRIEIFSPGSFPGNIGKNLRAGFTHLRNSALCKILREMGIIENFGFGIITTFSRYEESGLKAPTIIEGENFIKCILPRATPENMLTRNGDNLPETTQRILELFATINEVSVADVIKNLSLTRPTATRKLAELVNQGILKKTGKGRGVRYVKH